MRLQFSFKIGTIFKTRVRIHYTWLLVFILIPWTVSTQYSVETDFVSRILLGFGTAAMFFLAVIIREIVLLAIAQSKGINVRSVTVFAFGGLTQTDNENDTPSIALLLTVSGMLANFGITGLFYITHLFFGQGDSLIWNLPLRWMAFFYLTLSLFHIFPIYPLEGGKLVHVLIWKVTGSMRKATRISAVSGWILGFLVMAGGILLIVSTDERFTGMFFTGLGLILQNAATHGFRFSKLMPLPLPFEPVPVTPENVEIPLSGIDETTDITESDTSETTESSEDDQP